MTIEKRAKYWAENSTWWAQGGPISAGHYTTLNDREKRIAEDSYDEGATDQKKIGVERLKTILMERLPMMSEVEVNENGEPLASSYCEAITDKLEFIDSICKAMEE